jgi:hypothetical protein
MRSYYVFDNRVAHATLVYLRQLLLKYVDF